MHPIMTLFNRTPMTTSFPDYRQQATFRWVPWNINYCNGWSSPTGWLCLGDLVLSYGLGPDTEERSVWSWGPWLLSRPETPEERDERLEGEEEAAFMEHEASRYVEWSY